MATAGLADLHRLGGLDDGDEQPLLEALARPAEPWRLAALQGLARRGHPVVPSAAERMLGEGVVDPFLAATCRLHLAAAGRADPADLAARALGRRGVPWEGPWPPRPRVARRTGGGWPLRRLAVQALAYVPDALATLRRVIADDPDWAVREAAVLAVAGPPAAPRALSPVARAALELAREDRRAAVRRAALRLLGASEPSPPDGPFAWRVPGSEPYFRYVAASAREAYGAELEPATRNGPGRNWATFGLELDLDLDEQPPKDVSPHWPAIKLALAGVEDAMSLARDLVHHPAVPWGDEPDWPVCCGDYAVLYGHDLAATAPATQELERWFVESLRPDLPRPAECLPELDAEVYAFRCGRCGRWQTAYDPELEP